MSSSTSSITSSITSAMWDWIAKAHELTTNGTPFVVATIIEQKGSVPRGPGAKMIISRTAAFGTVGGGQLEAKVILDARQAMEQSLEQATPYPLCFKTGQCCGGAVEVLYELVGSGPQLYIFGAGHVGQAVCRTLTGTPFNIHLLDSRPEWLLHPDLPSAIRRCGDDWCSWISKATWSKTHTYSLVMTHEHAMDEAIIAQLVTRPGRFIGLIGSATKWERFQQRLTKRGINEDLINRVHCPIGLKENGKAPQEIAISVAADLLRRHYECV